KLLFGNSVALLPIRELLILQAMQTEFQTPSTKTYTQDEAHKAALNYFKGDDLAAMVWVNKYALKDSQGNIHELSPDDMHHRLAREIARIEAKYPNPMQADEIF